MPPQPDPIDLLDEASWLFRGPYADDHTFWEVLRVARTVGDLRRLLALARDAERLRTALNRLARFVDLWLTGDEDFNEVTVHDQIRKARAALEGTALAEPKQGSGPPGKGPYDPDRIGARVAALGGTDR